MTTDNTSERDDGGPAFPIPGLHADEAFNGMTLRDYFAAKAMQAFIGNVDERIGGAGFVDIVGLSAGAYKMADAMLKARKQ